MTAIIRLGAGRFVINHGDFGKDAAIFIEPADPAGSVGADASGQLRKNTVVEDGTVITFENIASAEVLRDEIDAAIKRIGAAR